VNQALGRARSPRPLDVVIGLSVPLGAMLHTRVRRPPSAGAESGCGAGRRRRRQAAPSTSVSRLARQLPGTAVQQAYLVDQSAANKVS
jgi:hypothetical protein